MTDRELREFLRSGSKDARELLDHIVVHTTDRKTRDQVDEFLDNLDGDGR